MQQARQVNVDGIVKLLDSVAKHCHLQRAVHLSGYMLTLQDHLSAAGVCLKQIEQTNWQQVYHHLGAYEASKIEGHFRWIQHANAHDIPWTVIHSATVLGDEKSGTIPGNQPIAHLI